MVARAADGGTHLNWPKGGQGDPPLKWIWSLMSKKVVEMGDRFVAVDAPNIVWVAQQIFKSAKEPVRHVVVVQEGQNHREKTLSEAVLLDPRFHRKV